MVPVDSDRVPRAPSYSGSRWVLFRFRLRGLHPLRLTFQCHSTIRSDTVLRSYNPSPETGLGCSDFARHYSRNHFCFLFLQVLRCFNSLGCPQWVMYWLKDDIALPISGCPIRRSPDRCLFTTPRGVSPLTASFISCMCLGIRRTLFLTWSTFDFLFIFS